MSLRFVITLNCALVLAVGLFGLFSDQPYWRAVGTAPWLYDYANWLVLLCNGLSGFLSAFLTMHLIDDFDWSYILQYILWLAFLPLQWFIYWRLADWASGTSRRAILICVAAVALAAGGGILAARTLIWNMSYDQEMGGFLDVYSGPVFIFAAAISGLWVVALLRKKKPS